MIHACIYCWLLSLLPEGPNFRIKFVAILLKLNVKIDERNQREKKRKGKTTCYRDEKPANVSFLLFKKKKEVKFHMSGQLTCLKYVKLN